MLVNICMKFHEGTLNGFWDTERTQPYRKIYYFQFQRAITPKLCNQDLRFLRSASHLMLLYICVKFHENISNSFWVTERTQFCDRQTDGQTTRAKTICLPTLRGGDIISLTLITWMVLWNNKQYNFWSACSCILESLIYKFPISWPSFKPKAQLLLTNLQRAINPDKCDRICLKDNQVIYSSSPISWLCFKPLAQIISKVSYWQV